MIIKELAEEVKGQFTCLGEIAEKYITFSIPTEKEVKRTGKNGEIQKPDLRDNNLFIPQDLEQADYQIFLKILFKEFTKLNVIWIWQ